ncbi:hypothetical protein PFJ87_10g00480 [Encephalitozoon hellem]|uniref:C2H2-type domain-containing protein n=1 Tax=Encephalitozoon hellem TaxID=27973 RepID=A0ABY8CPI1_ENCHE|nr:hypothetical protein PFJ87_10g00480 [Encephalitozoon hellem]
MKCSACQVEVDGNIRDHYASEVHKINVKRQIYNAPPITIEEINADQPSDDVSLEINGLDAGERSSKRRSKKRSSSKRETSIPESVCLFCDFPESAVHYKSHGLSDEEIAYINSRVCYVCYEAFSDYGCLRRHISSGKHRNVVTDGVNLILENGKVIQGRARARPREEEPIQRSEGASRIVLMKNPIKEDKKAIMRSKNQLKISLSMNYQPRYRPDWMQ